jgi:hypothetical protein
MTRKYGEVLLATVKEVGSEEKLRKISSHCVMGNSTICIITK